MAAIQFTCPAADPYHPADSALPACRCGVLRNANREEEIGGWSARGQVSALVDPRTDPTSITAFCAGDFSQCPVWRAEVDRIDAGRSERGGLHSEQHKTPNPGREAALQAMMSGMRA